MNHHIKRGDTLWALSRRYGTTVDAFARLNGISNPNLIIAGKTLRVPGHGGASSFTPASRPGGSSGTSSVSAPRPGGSGSLADNARRVALSMGGYNSQGLCATGVSRAILATYGIKVWGNGNQIDNNLPRSRFKEVTMPLSEALKIPGLVLTWEKTSTRLGSIYGHTAITSGDGRTSYSDFIERNTTNNGRSGLRIFMPI